MGHRPSATVADITLHLSKPTVQRAGANSRKTRKRITQELRIKRDGKNTEA